MLADIQAAFRLDFNDICNFIESSFDETKFKFLQN